MKQETMMSFIRRSYLKRRTAVADADVMVSMYSLSTLAEKRGKKTKQNKKQTIKNKQK